MASKSIEFKIGADTSDFLKNMKVADKEVTAFEKSAKGLETQLNQKYDSSKAEQAYKNIQHALELTNTKATELKSKLVELESAGKMDSADYLKVQDELVKTENKALVLSKELKDIQNLKFTTLANNVSKVGDAFTKAGQAVAGLSLASAGVIAGLAKATITASQNADEISTLSKSYNLSTDAIQKWAYVAEMSGIDSDSLYNAVRKLNTALGEQSLGKVDNYTKALETLGITASDYGDDTDKAFKATLEALSKVTDSTQQASIATDLFGDGIATQVIAVVKQGSDAIDDYISEFGQIGSLSESSIESLNNLDMVFKQLKIELANASSEMITALLPVIQDITTWVNDNLVPAIKSFANWLSSLTENQQQFLIGALAVSAALSPILLMIGKILSGVASFIKVLPTLTSLLKVFTSQSLLTFGAVASLAGVMGQIVDLAVNWNKLTVVQRILKGLSATALAAAAAIMVFHSAWSLGTAVAGIIAGIVAGAGAIMAVASQFGVDSGEISSVTSAGSDIVSSASNTSSSVSSTAGTGTTGTGNTTTDNSVTNINVNVQGTDATPEEIAEAVSKALATKVQVRR